MSFRTDRVRLAVLFKRKPTISKEEFVKYWAETHGPLFSSLDIVKKNILKYEQAHTNEAVLKQITKMNQLSGAPNEWDGIAIFEAESYEKISEVIQNEEYQKILVPDGDNFLDVQNCQMLPLDLITFLDK
ncbi:hypothetical protein B0H12DRAFT_1013346 [Mycena haematopus]|nr:hypothetical protein B0H12DRAFT_1013346 [Mycena haematopus]